MPTGISYLDEVWQPVTGCTPCSPGCENCYAATMAQTGRLRNHRRYKGLATCKAGPSGLHVGKWTGEVRCNEEDLTQPLKWRKSRRVGCCFMGDLFHPDVPDAFLDKVFAVMALCPQHQFVVCTKRAERMREYLTGRGLHNRIERAAEEFTTGQPSFSGKVILPALPFPGVHLGVTVESHEQLGRAAILCKTPAAHRWLSIEPMLDYPDLTPWLTSCEECGNAGSTSLFGHRPPGDGLNLCRDACDRDEGPGIDLAILGCESGPNRRPCNLDWVRQVIDDCDAAGVALYVKQLNIDGKVVTDPARFPADLRQRELPWRLDNESE